MRCASLAVLHYDSLDRLVSDVKDFDLNLLPVAFAIYDELSVSRAARTLGMSQPAVSMALRRMREMLKDELFIPVATGVTPTPRAHALIQATRPGVERLRKDLLAVEQFDPAVSRRTFRIAVSDIGEMVLLSRTLRPLRRQAPHCAIESLSVAPEQLSRGLEDGEIDVAIGYFPPLALQAVRQRRVSIEQFACLMRQGHPLQADRLSLASFTAAEHIVIAATGRSQEVLERSLSRRHIRRSVALITPHFLSVPFIVAQSDLIATVPRSVATYLASVMPGLAVVDPQFEIAKFNLKLHWHRRFDTDRRNLWLREQLTGELAPQK